ncbi:SgcJ/EcaC family oxidoreductase [Maribius pontilimi]|uniref:SgcJ/EcaC family oxidoreductase n=1 Tax=Palleronia pontilimi TaxID=1964209 RepID=A0A934IB31_9RHOB|nr:SgcJ/EcaC family oxidoreductase [Palleronia pontilimi]MBJ3763823.1 SgcJ/EcaC family oxidoreductase [Palleronia pontilimi]
MLLAAAALVTAGNAVTAQSVEDQLREAEDKWQELFNAGDAAGLADLYTEDAMRLPPDGSRTVGRDAIEAALQGDFDAGLENIQLDATEIGHDGNLGYVVGDNTIDFPKGDAMGTGSGNYVLIYRKEDDGTWRILVETWNDAP